MIKDDQEKYVGVEAVIDKDLSSAILASDIKADLFVVLTGVDRVTLNYGKDNEQPLDRITCQEAKQYMKEGQFPPGSMGPKIKAAVSFIELGGEKVYITSPNKIAEALEEKTGTLITK